MKLIIAAMLAATLAAPAMANQELAQKKNCLACHAVDKKVVGPAYKDVAAKYKADKNAEANLAKKIRAGGVGVWGQVPMPPNTTVSPLSTKTWVLTCLVLMA